MSSSSTPTPAPDRPEPRRRADQPPRKRLREALVWLALIAVAITPIPWW